MTDEEKELEQRFEERSREHARCARELGLAVRERRRCTDQMERVIAEPDPDAAKQLDRFDQCRAELDEAFAREEQVARRESELLDELMNDSGLLLKLYRKRYMQGVFRDYKEQVKNGVPEPRWDELVRLCRGYRSLADRVVQGVRADFARDGGEGVHEYFVVELAISRVTRRRLAEGDTELAQEAVLERFWIFGLIGLGAVVNWMLAMAVVRLMPTEFLVIFREGHDLWLFTALPGILLSGALLLLHPRVLPLKRWHQWHASRYVAWVFLGVALSDIPIAFYYS